MLELGVLIKLNLCVLTQGFQNGGGPIGSTFSNCKPAN